MTKPLLLALLASACSTTAPLPQECADAGTLRVTVECRGRNQLSVFVHIAGGEADASQVAALPSGVWLDDAMSVAVSMDGTCRVDVAWADYQLVLHGASPGDELVGEATTSDDAECVVTYRGRGYGQH